MFQETNRSVPDEKFNSYSIPSSSFSNQQPLFRNISDLPRSALPDYVASSSLTAPQDVYRSIEQPSAGVSSFSEPVWSSAPTSFSSSNHGYPLTMRGKELQREVTADYGSFHNDPYRSVQHYEKTKSIEDLPIQSFPGTSAVLDAVPPSVPEYIDPFYHFSSHSTATDLYECVLMTLERNGVDVDPKPEKFRFKCKTYPNGSLIYFIVRIYRDSKKNECIVECQRRSGCVLSFADFYKNLRKQVDPKTKSDSSIVTPRRDTEINQENAQETTQCLLLMASSHFVDVKSKAVEALASLSCQDRGLQDILIENGSINLLLEGCAKFDKVEDVHRPSLTALANLSAGRVDVCRTIAEKSLQCLSEKYTSPKENCPQVVRECARVLANIGHNLKDTMRSVDCSTAVQNLSRSSDPLAQQCARELRMVTN